MIPRYWQNSIGTAFSRSSSAVADTYPITRALGPVATDSFQVREYGLVSYLVHFSMHLALLNRISSFVQVL